MNSFIDLPALLRAGLLPLLLGSLALPAGAAPAEQVASAAAVATPTTVRLLPAAIFPGAKDAAILASARAGRRIVAAGDHGVVLLSDDDGATFRQARSVPVSSTLTALSFADASNGWAVGQWGVILHTTDGGETWSVQRSDLSTDQPLFSVHFANAQEGWAVGLWSLMLATSDGGKTWQTLTLPPPPGAAKADRNLYKIFADHKGGLFVTSEQGLVLRSRDHGASWQYLATGYKGTFWSGMATAKGALLVGGLRGSLYASQDGGDSWEAVPTGTKSSITDFAQARSRVVAVGLDGLMLEADDGATAWKASQRDDRLALTALVAGLGDGFVLFSKKGPVRAAR